MMRTSALTLQRGLSMMVRVVGMLAALAVTGCGVGVQADDPEGAAAVGTAQAELQRGCTDPMGCPEMAVVAQTAVVQSVTAAQTPGSVALPQDPIPWRPTAAQLSNRPFGPHTPETGVPSH